MWASATINREVHTKGAYAIPVMMMAICRPHRHLQPAGEVVDGGIQACQRWGRKPQAAEALGNLVANVASLVREIKVLAWPATLPGNFSWPTTGNSRIKLHFAVDCQFRRELLRFDGGINGWVGPYRLAGALRPRKDSATFRSMPKNSVRADSTATSASFCAAVKRSLR